MLSSLILIFIAICFTNAQKLAFGNTQGSNMVLQQGPEMAKIWGNGTVGSKITVKLVKESSNQIVDTQTATTGSNGLWSIYLKPVTASNDAYSITASDGTTTISMGNILFGDVFVCSGQSNMQFSVAQAFNATEEIAAANNYPMIRLFTASLIGSPQPQINLLAIAEPWSVASNKTVGGPQWNYMSAMCWFFGRNLYDYRKYPIGLIGSDYGGTPVRYWSSPDALKKCNESVSTESTHKQAKSENYNEFTDKGVQLADSQLWNAQIYPFLQTTIKGAIWYQGESDANNPYAMEYACAFPAMIADWREKWSQNSKTSANFPFGYVHLSTWGDGTSNKTCGNNIGCQYAAIVRWAQSANYGYVPNEKMPNVFMATAVDYGDPTSPFGDIHPRYKQQVAERLATAAKEIVYGETGLYWQGPLVSQAVISGNNVVVTFKNIGSKPLIVKNSYGFEMFDGKNWITMAGEAVMNGKTAVSLPIPSSIANANDVKQIRYGWYTAPCFPEIGPMNCAIGATEWPAMPFLVNVTAS